ncbi:MAG: hypothetical protein QG560_711, partial [Campylobacterota bacterium]|nr:hypothetical protein [Campylobacterota bacterium]
MANSTLIFQNTITVICLLTKKIKTKNIVASINKFAAENDCSQLEFSFSIDGVETYIKTTANDDFALYSDDDMGYFSNHEKMVNEHVRLKQIYSITIKQNPKRPIKLNYNINFSDNNA